MEQDSCDVLIIGSGMGGMCAAAMLVQAGLKTVVVERMPQIGGRCSTRAYKGFTLPTGVDLLTLGGGIEQVFNDVGAKYELVEARADVWRVGGKDYDMPGKGQLRSVIHLLTDEDKEETERVWGALKRALSWQDPSDGISLRDWLLGYTGNQRLLKGFDGIALIFLGEYARETPAGEFFRFLRAPRPSRVGFPPNGCLAVMESLSKAIQRKGAVVWTSCEAKQILVKDGVAKGAVVQKGEDKIEMAAKFVISDAGPRKTVEMAGSINFDEGYLKLIREVLRPSVGICIEAATDKPLVQYPVLNLPEADRVVQVFCPTLLCPDLAPRGKHLLWAMGLLRSSLPPYRFAEEEELCMRDLTKFFPGFENAEILGVRHLNEDYPYFRSCPGYSLPQKTPVMNLYNVGDGVMPSGQVATMACEASARSAVQDIKMRTGRV